MRLALFRRHKLFSASLALVAVLFLGVVLLIVYSEPIVKFLAEGEGSRKVGREIVIEGPLRIGWGWRETQVHAEHITLSNAPGYAEKNMLQIAQLDFSFRPWKLLIGKLELPEINIQQPQLVLERRTEQEMNWDFPVLSQASVAGAVLSPDDRFDFPLIGRLQIQQGRVIYRDAPKGMDLDLKLNSISGHGGGKKAGKKLADKAGFTIAGNGTIQDQRFTLDASGGSLELLRETEQPFPLRLNLVMGHTHVLIEGTFSDPVKLTGIDSSLKISGHNLADLFYLTAIPLPPTPPYRLEGQLTKEGGVWGYNQFDGKVGESDLSGNLSYDTGGERGFLKANLVSNVLDSEDLGGFIGLSPSGDNAAPEQKAAAAKEEERPKLIPDVPLALERLRATDLDVTLKANRIEAPSLPFKGMHVRFALKEGVLNLDPLDVTLADGSVDGRIHIDAQKDVPKMDVRLNLRNLSLGQFFQGTRFEKSTSGRMGGRVELKGEGLSLADVLASSNGKLAVIMSGGKISLLLVEAADLDVAQALPLFIGSDRPTPIRCGVADFVVSDGVLNSRAVVLDTEDSRLIGKVDIDLRREVVNARLDAKPKDFSLAAAKTPITISGTLKSPAVGIEAKKASTQAASAIALGVLITPFAALLPFIELGDDKDANCRALIEAAGGAAVE